MRGATKNVKPDITISLEDVSLSTRQRDVVGGYSDLDSIEHSSSNSSVDECSDPTDVRDLGCHAFVKRHRCFGYAGVCLFGTFVIVLLLSPAILYTMLLDGQYFYEINADHCDMSAYAGDFPAPIREFYASQGLTDMNNGLVNHADWYLGPWRAYPHRRGICPINAITTDPWYKDTFGAEAPKVGPALFTTDHYCLRTGTDYEVASNVLQVFANIDNENKGKIIGDVLVSDSDMKGAMMGFKITDQYLIYATWVTWLGIALNFALLPTIGYHHGTLIFLNILAWWLPAIFCLNKVIFGDFNSNHNWDPLFPTCTVRTITSFTPGVMILYWQAISLGIWLLAVTWFALYTLCYKSWSNEDEDCVDLGTFKKDDSKFIYREKPSGYNEITMEWLQCSEGHNLARTFEVPNSYIQANLKPCVYHIILRIEIRLKYEYETFEDVFQRAGLGDSQSFSELMASTHGPSVMVSSQESVIIVRGKQAAVDDAKVAIVTAFDKVDGVFLDFDATINFVNGEITCTYCSHKNIDDQRNFAYFGYCPTCMDKHATSGANIQPNGAQDNDFQKSQCSICMKCMIRWRDGITLNVAKRPLSSRLSFMKSVRLSSSSLKNIGVGESNGGINWANELSSNDESTDSEVDGTKINSSKFLSLNRLKGFRSSRNL